MYNIPLLLMKFCPLHVLFYTATLKRLSLQTNSISFRRRWFKNLSDLADFSYQTLAHKCHTHTHCKHLAPFYPIEPVSFPRNQLFNQTLPQIEDHEVLENDSSSFHATLCCPAEPIDNFYEVKLGYTWQLYQETDLVLLLGDHFFIPSNSRQEHSFEIRLRKIVSATDVSASIGYLSGHFTGCITGITQPTTASVSKQPIAPSSFNQS